MSPFIILFKNPTVLPSGGYLVSYRPKGTDDAYFTLVSPTGSPIKIIDNILPDTDYEGFVQSICGELVSTPGVPFSTSVYG